MPHLSFSANAELTQWLTVRAEHAPSRVTPGTRAKTELELWRASLALELRRTQWTLPELRYLAHLYDGAVMDDTFGALLAAGAADGDESVAARFGVDHHAIIGRLAMLGPTQDHALREAIARWWQLPTREHSVAGWNRVGVRVLAELSATSPTSAEACES